MSSQAYAGTAQRTFPTAVQHLLETEYGILGSQRVLELLAHDLHALVEQFFPPRERVSSGWLVFTGTKATGPKPAPGQPASAQTLVTLAWPVLLPEDVTQASTFPAGPTGQAARQAWLQQRLVRLIDYGWQYPDGPVLLTLADLGLMLGLSTVQVSQLLTQARRATGKPLLTKGYYFDQGMRPTHKDDIIALYEAGLDEAEIARRSQHTLTSVGHYLRDYEKVKLLMTRHIPTAQIGPLVNLQPNVVQAYLDLLKHYHPDLVPEPEGPTAS